MSGSNFVEVVGSVVVALAKKGNDWKRPRQATAALIAVMLYAAVASAVKAKAIVTAVLVDFQIIIVVCDLWFV